ncbi:MAG: hypothetical protein AAGB04_04545, partial [Pseudomonadota bacterium]
MISPATSLSNIFLIQLYIAIVLATSSALAAAEIGESDTYPRVDGNVIFRLANDSIYAAETSFARNSVFGKSKDYFGEMIASPTAHFSESLSISSEIRLEGVRPPTEDRVFEDQGLFARKLFAEFSLSDHFSLHAGKFTPSFALASLVAPGMYGINFSKEIELIERIGFGSEYVFDVGESGKHKLSVSTFFDDTSILSDSLGSRRGQKRLSDGGASN